MKSGSRISQIWSRSKKGGVRTAAAQAKSSPHTQFVKGSVLRHSHLDLAKVTIGQRLDIPYEITVDSGWRDNWQSSFYQQDRIHTSLSFAQATGLNQIPIPNTLALFSACSMSHVDSTRDVYDLRIKTATYEKPIYPLDTLRRIFVIQDIRESSNGKNVITDVLCKMFNQHGQRVYSLVKTMMFTKSDLGDSPKLQEPLEWKVPESALRDLVTKRPRRERLEGNRGGSLHNVAKGDLVLHNYMRPPGSTAMNLSTQHRMTHPRLFNTSRFKSNELFVAAPIILAAAHASAAHELYEVYHESTDNAVFPNPCSPDDTIGAFTYIKDVKSLPNDLEELKVVTVGVKNMDVSRALNEQEIPLSLFEGQRTNPELGITPSELEGICEEHVPALLGKILVHSERTLVREQPALDPEFLL